MTAAQQNPKSHIVQSPLMEKGSEVAEEMSPPNPNQEHDHSSHSVSKEQPHFIGTWQHYCPTCGDANPDFKDETECSTCHTHLGAAATAEKLKACPNCGGKQAKRLK